MPIAKLLTGNTDQACELVMYWGITTELAHRLERLAMRLEFPLSVISGYRSPAQQDDLRRQGRPTADNDKSTHLGCPATGVDVWPGVAVTRYVKARLGAEAGFSGLRWGGDSPVDPETGIPSDWNHLDLGPRWRAPRAEETSRAPG